MIEAELESIVARGVHKGIGDRHAAGMPTREIIRAVTKELLDDADVVRSIMELKVWGMAK